MLPLVPAARATTGLAVVATLAATAALVAHLTDIDTPLPSGAGLHLLLLTYVSVVGALVARYVATNLRGQRRQRRFAVLLVATVLALALMVATGHLVLSAVGATLSGWTLAALVSHREDPAARRAARTVRRHLVVGDVALWAAVGVHLLDGPGTATALALVVACVVRSTLAPAHRWLPETSEAPSPVSALLHGGVVNGGLMLLLIHWSLVSTSGSALLLLGLAGGASVALGLAQLRLRPDVKGRLASSTSAQMGLGALALALALPQAALVHVLGHGLWKGWLFLRAGGSVARASAPAALPLRHAQASRSPAVVLGAGVAGGLAVLAGGLLLGNWLDVPGGLALPAGLAATLTAVAVVEAVRLERTGRPLRSWLALGSVLAMTGYLASVALLDLAIHGWFAQARPPVAIAWSLLVVAGIVVVAASVARWQPHTATGAAVLAGPGLLPPGARLRGDVRDLAAAHRAPTLGPDGDAAPFGDLDSVALVASSSVGTAWPLHSLVAVNPLADLERFPVEDAARMVARLHGRDPRPSLGHFLDLHARGIVSRGCLEQALTESGDRHGVPQDLETFLAVSRDGARATDGAPLRVRACDLVPARGRGRTTAELLDLHAASWTARAWGQAGGRPAVTDPWTLWRTSASRPAYDLAWGLRGASAWVRTLPASPHAAASVLWPRLRERVGVDVLTYAASVLTAAPGWTGHAKWRAGHGDDPDALVQLLALRMALDLLLAHAHAPQAAPPEPPAQARTEPGPAHAAVAVWQRALDLAARDGLVGALTSGETKSGPGVPSPVAVPSVQSVWCIDVRSERVRRFVETVPGHHTHGYAGFFGAAVRHVDADGTSADLCPGLLRPGSEVRDLPQQLSTGAAVHRWVTRIGRHPAASFGYAEINGLPALLASLLGDLAPARWRRAAQRFSGSGVGRVQPGPRLPHDVAVEAAQGLLLTTGLAWTTAPVVVLVGHASSTENNAFAAAYDCGACGGHQGALNALLVADALNEPTVRAALAERGLEVPEEVVFVAAQHDTTTDEVRWVGGPSPQDDPRVARALTELDAAGARAAEERRVLLPGLGRRPLKDRAADWSEPMPEWGLAGNLALVVGPRDLTAGLDLGGTAFLHSYEADRDPDGSILASVMAGPVVVTQWINAQYHASTSAPTLFGSGDKTVHNVVGGTGIIAGAHGDLRTGLPWQAVADHDVADDGADTSILRHLPARHLVVVAAPRDRVETAVRANPGLRAAVGHGWLQLLVVEQAPGSAHRVMAELGRELRWSPVEAAGPPRPTARLAQPR